jgi:hypothetical protein
MGVVEHTGGANKHHTSVLSSRLIHMPMKTVAGCRLTVINTVDHVLQTATERKNHALTKALTNLKCCYGPNLVRLQFPSFNLRAYRSSVTVSSISGRQSAVRQALSQPRSISFNPMSTNPSPELKTLFEAALNEFEKRAGTDLVQHQIIDKLVSCESADSVIDVLQEQAQAFRRFRGDDGKLVTWLKRTVNVLYTLSTSGVLGEGIGLVCFYSFLWHAPCNTFSFSHFHQQRQSSPDSVYFLA